MNENVAGGSTPVHAAALFRCVISILSSHNKREISNLKQVILQIGRTLQERSGVLFKKALVRKLSFSLLNWRHKIWVCIEPALGIQRMGSNISSKPYQFVNIHDRIRTPWTMKMYWNFGYHSSPIRSDKRTQHGNCHYHRAPRNQGDWHASLKPP